MFIDQVLIDVSAGNGGSGMTAFRRESRVPKGGPSGGDGGRGGSVYLLADPQLWTLLDYTYRPKWAADSGEPGGPSQQSGRSAEDLVLPVPCGTEVRDRATGEMLGEVVRAGDRLLVAQGGRGGFGNQHFATPTHQTPHEYQPGEDGERKTIELTLKLIADVGLLGQPNAGKSTLLAAVTAARPKIADYPFTTLEPNLGVVQLRGHRTFVIADIPGIIEGAHQGKGLGLKFLRHIERTRVLVYLIPADTGDRDEAYAMLRREIEAFSPALAAKPHCVVLNKMDLVPAEQAADFPAAADAFARIAISGLQRRGLDELLETLWERLVEARREAEAAT
ncbi:MAG: GTPase ObgE [Gemmatimonadales bacterium]|jgi:GTP-binding protein